MALRQLEARLLFCTLCGEPPAVLEAPANDGASQPSPFRCAAHAAAGRAELRASLEAVELIERGCYEARLSFPRCTAAAADSRAAAGGACPAAGRAAGARATGGRNRK